MRLYLGTHEPSWIGRSPVPLFVSMSRFGRFPFRGAIHGWALDSGGFTQLQRGGWTQSPLEYLERVERLREQCPGMEWAAPQDWMCEPSAREATGLSVEEHQHRTVENFCQLRSLGADFIVPVLQGWGPGEHERCRELYATNGVDLGLEPLVGVGSICRREGTPEIAAIIRSLSDLRLHGFGVKTTGLGMYGDSLVSADSLAWSLRARWAGRDGKRLCRTKTHASCNNCYEWAHIWYEELT